jgi:hypothetical protein
MSKYQWAELNTQQLGAYAEYFVKMEFTIRGFQVFSPEVDDRGIDFITRFNKDSWFEIQVKSIRDSTNYIFLRKDKFELSSNLYAAITILTEDRFPDLFLIPSLAWKLPNELFVERNYEGEGQVSRPEWGMNVSKKNRPLLDAYRFEKAIQSLIENKI